MHDDDIDDEDLDEEEGDFEDGDEDGDDDGEESGPSNVFVSMAFGREGSDAVWEVIETECENFDLTAWRAHQTQFAGSPSIDDVVAKLVDVCDMAVIDLTHERPSVAHEIGMCDREFDRALILFVAKAGTPRFANIESRLVNYYADAADLQRILARQLTMMCEAWERLQDLEDDDDEDDE
jgi:hypothetical protein